MDRDLDACNHSNGFPVKSRTDWREMWLSVRLTTAVWSSAPLRGAELLILLALADYANDEGYLHPSPVGLAKKARVARETAWRAITRFEKAGVLQPLASPRPRDWQWRLILDALPNLGSTVTTDHAVTTDHVTTDHAYRDDRSRDRDDRSRSSVTTDHKEPSVEPSVNRQEPSRARARPRSTTDDRVEQALAVGREVQAWVDSGHLRAIEGGAL